MSISGGFDKAVLAGSSIGCSTIQIFTKSNRQWSTKKLSTTEIDGYTEALAKTSIKPVVAHTSYLINIGSSNKNIEKKSMLSLSEEIQRCAQLNIPYLVLHPGSYTGGNKGECLDRIIDNLNVITHKGLATTLLLELMAGQGSTVCSTFEELEYIYRRIDNNKHIGICFDTCHAWAAGYDFSTAATYEAMWHHFNTTLGLKNLKVIHINDSKGKKGSNIDRHETIGAGTIGLDAFAMIMNDPNLYNIPKILETPKKTLADDVHNMDILRKLVTEATHKKLEKKIK
jgi:deoxyribonuclease-4